MNREVVGVGLDDFRLPTREGLDVAARMGFGAVEIGATRGDTAVDALSSTGRGQLARLVRGLGMNLASLDADVLRESLTDSRHVEQVIERTCQILTLARDMRVPVVTVAVGALRGDSESKLAVEALCAIGAHADRVGTILAVSIGESSAESLASCLKRVNCPSLGACVDSGALLLRGDDAAEAVNVLADGIAHSRARDAIRGGAEGGGLETALGDGHLDLTAYLVALESVDYRGPQIIRRRDAGSAARAADDIARSKAYLETHAPH